MNKIVHVIAAVALIACGYLFRAYTEKPKTVEVPVEKVIVKTKYIDKITKQPVEVIKEVTKYDPEAEERILKASIKKQSLVFLSYGVELDNFGSPYYGITYNKRVFNNVFAGVSLHTNGSATINVGFEF